MSAFAPLVRAKRTSIGVVDSTSYCAAAPRASHKAGPRSCRSVRLRIGWGGGARPYEAGEILMSSRSERYLANAEKCQQYANAVNTFGTKRLYEELSRQWLRLAEQAEETGRIESPPTSAGRMPLRGPQPISLNTSAINSRRDIFESLEREIECFKNSVQPPSQESPVSSGAQD